MHVPEKAGVKSNISSSEKYRLSQSSWSLYLASSTNRWRFWRFNSLSLESSSSNSLIVLKPHPRLLARNCLRSCSSTPSISHNPSMVARSSFNRRSLPRFSSTSLSFLARSRTKSSLCSPNCSGASRAYSIIVLSVCACGVPSSAQR